MRISKKVREEAALICAVAASSPRRHPMGTWLACEGLGLSSNGPEERLAGLAFQAALPSWQKWLGKKRRPFPAFAEAEALLRCGWTP